MTKKRIAQIEAMLAKKGPIRTLRNLDSWLANLEGKKTQAQIAQVREIRKLLSDLFIYEDENGGLFDPAFEMIKNK